MPQNKRESLIYTFIMCFMMVFWMSIYNVSLHMGGLSMESIKAGWLGFPIAYILQCAATGSLYLSLRKDLLLNIL